jgi:hypothetical protein
MKLLGVFYDVKKASCGDHDKVSAAEPIVLFPDNSVFEFFSKLLSKPRVFVKIGSVMIIPSEDSPLLKCDAES